MMPPVISPASGAVDLRRAGCRRQELEGLSGGHDVQLHDVEHRKVCGQAQPGAYYVPLRSSWQINDVPMGTTTSGNFVNDINNGTLPNCSFVTPDMCNSTHDCSVGTGDAFLQTWVSKIMAGPDYQRGNTVIIIITWDESGATQAEIVISPSTHGTAESCSPKMARSR
jgi:Phosphoesterase family